MPSILEGGEVIADALVLGTPRIVEIVGVEVESGVGIGVVVVFFINIYPPVPTIVMKIIAIKINFHLLFEGGILPIDCCKFG
jgi:hypothetical protein